MSRAAAPPAFTAPRWLLSRWLLRVPERISQDIENALIATLYGSMPTFYASIANSIAIALLIAYRSPTWPILTWLGLSILIGAARGGIAWHALRAAASGRPTPTDWHILANLAFAATLGFGGFVTVLAVDWVSAAVVWTSIAAVAGGFAFRHVAAPRLAVAMLLLSLAPICAGAILSGELVTYICLLQLPAFVSTMAVALRYMNGLLVRTMQAERTQAHIAQHDPLTGLLNRTGLDETVVSRWPALTKDAALTVLCIDLDGFKTINDTHGHAAGDAVLRQFAGRLRGALRAEDHAARIGGDEFVVVAGIAEDALEARIATLVEALSARYAISDLVSVTVGVSIGAARNPELEFEALLREADHALYVAKSGGGQHYVMAGMLSRTLSLANLARDHRRDAALRRARGLLQR